MPLVSLDGLLGCMDLEAPAGAGAAPTVRFPAPSLDLDHHRVFGGQLLAQAIAVATATGDGKVVRSVTASFPREANADEPLELVVDRVHDGRTFSTRRVTAEQAGRACFLATVSLHEPGEGPTHDETDDGIAALCAAGPDDATGTDLSMIPWTTRVVDGIDLRDRAAGPARYAFWSRVEDRDLPPDRWIHQALLAHASDLTLIGTLLRPHEGLCQADAGTKLATAVTSHAMWFHRPFRMDQWCLVSQVGRVATEGRGFGSGHVADTDGRLLASFAQESMLRPLGSDGR